MSHSHLQSGVWKYRRAAFDLRMRRVLAYHMPSEAEQKSAERKLLESQLNIAIRAALEHEGNTNTSPTIPAIPAVENQRPNRIIVLRRNLDEILKKLDNLQPK